MTRAREPFFTVQQETESPVSLVDVATLLRSTYEKCHVASCDLGLGPSQQQVTGRKVCTARTTTGLQHYTGGEDVSTLLLGSTA